MHPRTGSKADDGFVAGEIGRACRRANFQFHQLIGREADCLAKRVRIKGLLDQVAQVHHVGGHRWNLESTLGSAAGAYRNIAGDDLAENLNLSQAETYRLRQFTANNEKVPTSTEQAVLE